MPPITYSYTESIYKQRRRLLQQELIDISDDLERFKQEIIPRCLTEQCQECSGLYYSEVLQIEIRCNYNCRQHSAEQYEGEKLDGAHSSVGSPEERQAVAITNPQQREGGGNCSNG
jgi:hypothetical protein